MRTMLSLLPCDVIRVVLAFLPVYETDGVVSGVCTALHAACRSRVVDDAVCRRPTVVTDRSLRVHKSAVVQSILYLYIRRWDGSWWTGNHIDDKDEKDYKYAIVGRRIITLSGTFNSVRLKLADTDVVWDRRCVRRTRVVWARKAAVPTTKKKTKKPSKSSKILGVRSHCGAPG